MSFSRAFAEGNNEVALALFRESLDDRGNMFFSPFSVRTVLGMIGMGARGETAAQINKVLLLSSSSETNQFALADTIHRLNGSGGGKCEMAVSNSIWMQIGMSLQAEFMEIIDRFYRGSVNAVDFRHDAEVAAATINRWVEETTRETLRAIVSSESLNPDTRMILVNAIYFKGLWEQPFPSSATRRESFYLDGGGQAEAEFMRQESYVGYLRGGGFQAVDLGYQGDSLSMLLIVPDDRDGLRHLEATLSESVLRDCMAKMGRRKVELFLPKFRMAWSTSKLTTWLSKLGMPLAFGPTSADFSGINGHKPPHAEALFISNIFHKAVVEVNEKGTEAAAVTAARFVTRSRERTPPPVPIVRADHPFLFAIVDRYSDSILFFGRMADPTKES